MDIRNSVNHGRKKQGTSSLRSEPHLTAFSPVAYDFVLVMRRTLHELCHYTQRTEGPTR